MRTISTTLSDADPALLPVLAEVWGIDTRFLDKDERVAALIRAMATPEAAERVWATLDDEQRGALQALIHAGAKMPLMMYQRLFGEIRKMGAGQIERERPQAQPRSKAEALYYKGLIGIANVILPAGPQPMVYVPDDLLRVLPLHKTAYEHLEEAEGDDEAVYDEGDDDIQVEAVENVAEAKMADTSIVDDLTTMLAYMQLVTPTLEIEPRMQALSDYCFAPADQDALLRHMLTPNGERLTFMIGLALSAELIEVQPNRSAAPKRAEARRWLAASRAEQVRLLAEAWRESRTYRELWHVPNLLPEPGGTLDSYDPAAIRGVFVGFLTDLVPKQSWWSLDSFIAAVKETDPDFQRPGGDYDTWYLRNSAGEYLEGFESWDAVEGALLEFFILSPMHWLGLMDVSEEAARLTVYGRAFVGAGGYPTPPDQVEKITVREDGSLLIPRKVSRIDRFQAARFTTWVSAGDPYTYRIDAEGIRRAALQSITTGHIEAFVSKALDNAPVPNGIKRLLESWQGGATTSVSLERLVVLRTTDPETLDAIFNAPHLRRYLGARLGPMAVIVRADQIDGLREALGSEGIEVQGE